MTSPIDKINVHNLRKTASETNLAKNAKKFNRDKLNGLQKITDDNTQQEIEHEQIFLSFASIFNAKSIKNVISGISEEIIYNPEYSGINAGAIIEVLKMCEQNTKLPLSELAKVDSSATDADTIPKVCFREKLSKGKLKHVLINTFKSTYRRIPAHVPESLQLALIATKLLAEQIVTNELTQSALSQEGVTSAQRQEILAQWDDLNKKQKMLDDYIEKHYLRPKDEIASADVTSQGEQPIANELSVKIPPKDLDPVQDERNGVAIQQAQQIAYTVERRRSPVHPLDSWLVNDPNLSTENSISSTWTALMGINTVEDLHTSIRPDSVLDSLFRDTDEFFAMHDI